MAKYNVNIDFTPTWDNASELLMDLAALYTSRPPVPEAEAADHSQCISLADHHALVQSLESKLEQETAEHERIHAQDIAELNRVNNENARLREVYNNLKAESNKPDPNAAKNSMIHVGEMVTILPGNDGKHQQYYGGIVKAIHGSGGSKGIEVLPRGHGHTVLIERKYIKRKAVNEREDTTNG
jgi:hypothetical protein